LTYNTDFAGRSTIERAFHEANIELDITLAAADTDIIKTYVRLGMGVGLIAAMAYHTTLDKDLVVRDLSQIMPKSSTKIATLKHNYLPLYGQHFIEELRLAGREFA
jgi:LysR family cys regulon transcriptional activator